MPVMLADSEDMEAVELLIGGFVDRVTTSNPPVTLVPLPCRLLTTAIARLGSTAIEEGGPLSATGVAAGAPWTCPTMPVLEVGSEGSRTVRSMEDTVFEPLLVTSASARS